MAGVMARLSSQVRFIAGALALAFMVAMASPVSAQQPSSVNPTASAVQEQQLLKELGKIQGRVSIPDTKSDLLEHPAGRDWRHFHTVTLKWIGAIAILGTLAAAGHLLSGARCGADRERALRNQGRALHGFRALRALDDGGLLHNSGLERPQHHVRPGVAAAADRPRRLHHLLGRAKYAHNFLSFPFTLGVVIIFFIWVAGNIPNGVDVEWVKRGGGIVGHDHPPAYRFNAGQKAIFWIQMGGGTAMVVSGYLLIFPFYGTTVGDMQLAEIAHATIAMLYIAAMIGHIYIGSLGMEGAFEAMGTGTVDLNWAKEHHSLWLTDENARVGPNESESQARARAAATPAE